MLVIPRDVADDLVAHARERAPAEVCGVLAGDHGPDRSVVAASTRTPNVADEPRTTYHMDPEAQLAAIEDGEEAGHEVVGFYHSHPAGPATPSSTDTERATWPGASYVIVALDGDSTVKSWRWNGDAGRFEREPVRVE